MSHFYGTIDGAGRNRATKTGNKSSGITTHAAGWGGAIRVDVVHDSRDGTDNFTVSLVPWQSSGGTTTVLARGVLNAQAGGKA